MQTLTLPPVKLLRECFTYDCDIGELRWKPRPRRHFVTDKEWKRWNVRFAGTKAGHARRHTRVQINAQSYTAHRVIWKWATGKEPPPNIDHKNRNGYDNRWVNLREADQTKQNWNKGLARNNTSGYKGVSLMRGKWRSVIYNEKVQRHLGCFNTAEEAAAAYAMAARKMHKEFYAS